ncbi:MULTISPECIES: esterase-like activity of phytase family protein [Meridianimarinicoccus]|uniref:esterase-like activity of phytase family protein n=1 Tax=Meridianimarinicoccus zhengii TaxID=2056810 RepID=UPI001F1D8530|nr:esterase-like activity of phytase family protein [Phycocomes zhengii]
MIGAIRRAVACGAILLAAAPLCAQPAEWLGSFTWDAPGVAEFGGFSGLVLLPDRAGFVAVTDKGWLAEGRLIRDGEQVVAVSDTTLRPLLGRTNAPLTPFMSDAEGLARAADGTLYVSFEGYNRVAALRPGETRTRWIDRHPDFDDLQTNSGLEAVATDPAGRLITLPERSGAWERPFPVFRHDGRAWSQPYTLRRDARFLPVGADTGPDGRLYLLERHFTGFAFASRVRSFAFTDAGLADERLVLETPPGRHDNLEAISVWRDDAGRIRLTMLSDDNFHFLQRTEFVDYAVPAATAALR